MYLRIMAIFLAPLNLKYSQIRVFHKSYSWIIWILVSTLQSSTYKYELFLVLYLVIYYLLSFILLLD